MNSPRTIKIGERLKAPVSSVPLLDVGRGNNPLKDEFRAAFDEILETGRFVGGPFCQQLEEQVATATDAKFAVGCASGSDALLLALMAINIQPGDRVICPSFTFFATASAIHRLGAVPVFADIIPGTFNLDPEHVESLITPSTKAIIPVHLFGQCANMDAMLDMAQRYGVKIIEDCAQSIGANWKGQGSGSLGSIGCFSFYPTKNLGGFGDGGMLTTNDEQLADRIRLLANHGMRPRYYHSEVGINSRLDSIQAAMLCVKMKHLDACSGGRQQNADNYDALFAASDLMSQIALPQRDPNCEHVWNQYTIRIQNAEISRDEVREQLGQRGVGSEIYYPVPLHQQECFQDLGYATGSLPNTEAAAETVLSLPIFPELTFAEQQYVVESLAEVLNAAGDSGRQAA